MENNIREIMQYYGIKNSNDIKQEGYDEKFDIYYYIASSNKSYTILDTDLLKDKIFEYIEDNLEAFYKLVPKFHITNIDNYISNILFNSLIMKDITDLFNTNILYFNKNNILIIITSELILKKLLFNCFEVLEENEKEIILKFIM